MKTTPMLTPQKIICLCIALFTGIFHAQAGTTYVVPPDTPAHTTNYPYNSWGTAATNIQTAINAAATEGYTHVLVATGIYEVGATLRLTNALTVRSDNAGVIDRTNTVVDGMGARRCLIMDHADALFAGFTITNGKTTALYSYGGGVLITNGTLSNCVVTGCSVIRRGGGIYSEAGGRIYDCLVTGNEAMTNGAGIYTVGAVTIARTIVSNNTLTGSGTTIGSGIYMMMQADTVARMYDSQILDNTGSSALYLYSGAYVISNCTIAGNTAGGIYMFGGDGLIANSVIRDNTRDMNGGGIFLTPEGTNCHTEIRNCLIADNTTSGSGGGLYFNQWNSRHASIVNCTIAGNHAASEGGGAYMRGKSINSIFYGNTVDAGTYSNVYNILADVNYSYSCVGAATVPSGEGNINSDPLFATPTSGDYRLQRGSPCINTGTNQMDWMPGARDMGGRQRLDWFSRQVDMGCYEYVPRGTMYQVR